MISLADALAAKAALRDARGGLAPVHAARALTDPTAHPHHNTVGYEVGLDPDGQPCVNVLVQAKLPGAAVHAEALAPRAIDGVPVRVVATGLIRARKLKQAPAKLFPRVKVKTEAASGVFIARARPARGGDSIGHYQITAGTIGALVALNDRRLAVLSNNHVLGNSNLGKPNDAILQPGAIDDGTAADVVAHLIGFAPLQWGGAPNSVDCALGWTRWDRIGPTHHSFTIDPKPIEESAVYLGYPVMKDGRTTGHTSGIVVGLDADIVVSYAPEGGNATFHGQFRIQGQGGTTFSQPGDSGSLIVSQTGANPTALLFAGGEDPDGTDSTFACPIAAVMSALNIKRFLNAVES